MVSSDGTPAPVNMHAGRGVVEKLGVARTCDKGDGRPMLGISWGLWCKNKSFVSSIGLYKASVEMQAQKKWKEKKAPLNDIISFQNDLLKFKSMFSF